MQEAQVQFLGQEDPMEKGMATKASILNCPQGCRVRHDMTEQLTLLRLSSILESGLHKLF